MFNAKCLALNILRGDEEIPSIRGEKKRRCTVGVGGSLSREMQCLTWNLHVEAEEREQICNANPAQEQVTGVT